VDRSSIVCSSYIPPCSSSEIWSARFSTEQSVPGNVAMVAATVAPPALLVPACDLPGRVGRNGRVRRLQSAAQIGFEVLGGAVFLLEFAFGIGIAEVGPRSGRQLALAIADDLVLVSGARDPAAERRQDDEGRPGHDDLPAGERG